MLHLIASTVDGPIKLERQTYITRDELKDLVFERLERDLQRQRENTYRAMDVDLTDVNLPDSVNLEDLMR